MLLTGSLILLVCALSFYAVLMVVSRRLFQDFQATSSEELPPNGIRPPAAVILCIRGADPTLGACLDGILTQEYPDFEVHVVLDSRSDPAADVVRDAIRETAGLNARVHILEDPDARRGLKVSAILQALNLIPERFQMIAFLDADAEPHPNWLRDLVLPLQSPGTGATSGVRWFEPSTENMGSLIRAKWNLYAVALMRHFNIAWGGSFAIRRDVLERTDLLNRWLKTLCEDTCLGDTLTEAGYQVRMVPEVSMINRESTTIAGCHRFITRQLVLTRLHSKSWIPILLFGLALSIVSLLIPLHIAVTLLQGDVAACLVASGTLVAFAFSVTLFENRTSELVGKHGCQATNSHRQHWTWSVKPALANYICQMVCALVSGAAFVSATFARRLEWRGIVYRVKRSQVTLVKYTPFVPAVADADSSLRDVSI